MRGRKQIARLPGIVQGVVVQMTTDAVEAQQVFSTAASAPSPRDRNFTQIVSLSVVVLDLGLGQRGLRPATTSPAWSRGRAGRTWRIS
jgi:hypothetical protein